MRSRLAIVLVCAWGGASIGGSFTASAGAERRHARVGAVERSAQRRVVAAVDRPAPRAQSLGVEHAERPGDEPAPSVEAPRTAAALRDNGQSICTSMTRPDRDRRFVSLSDARRAAVDGAALDAVVSRGAAASLSAQWEPEDLVELPSLRPITARECSRRGAQCLRRPAAQALVTMMAAMRRDGVSGSIHSTYRSYAVQCMVFRNWAYDDGRGFCRASTGSALPGHSQHQLGTTLDLLSVAWKSQGRGLSAEFGCSPAGRWIAAHAEEFGFVLPYPLHVDHAERASECAAATHGAMDPRTGYAYEPWHLRYIGEALTRDFAAARARSGRASAAEITVDQWLRQRAGRQDDADLPVCDGCACGACSTLVGGDASSAPCAQDEMLAVDADGRPAPSRVVPTILAASARSDHGRTIIDATLSIAAGTVTQTPAVGRGELRFEPGEDSEQWAPSARAERRAYRDLRGAARLAVAIGDGPFAYRVGLSDSRAATAFNGAAVYLPAPSGRRTFRLSIPSVHERVRVALWIDGRAIEPRELSLSRR